MLDQDLIENEIERIELLFEKNKYDDKQKKWFIEAKLKDAKELHDVVLLKVCEVLLERIN